MKNSKQQKAKEGQLERLARLPDHDTRAREGAPVKPAPVKPAPVKPAPVKATAPKAPPASATHPRSVPQTPTTPEAKGALAAAKTAKPKKVAPGKVPPPPAAARPVKIVTLVRLPKEGELRPNAVQARAILDIVAAHKRISLPELLAEMNKKIVHHNILGTKDVWNMLRKRLIDAGFITVS